MHRKNYLSFIVLKKRGKEKGSKEKGSSLLLTILCL